MPYNKKSGPNTVSEFGMQKALKGERGGCTAADPQNDRPSTAQVVPCTVDIANLLTTEDFTKKHLHHARETARKRRESKEE